MRDSPELLEVADLLIRTKLNKTSHSLRISEGQATKLVLEQHRAVLGSPANLRPAIWPRNVQKTRASTGPLHGQASGGEPPPLILSM